MEQLPASEIAARAAEISGKTSIAASGATFFAGLTLSEWGTVIGILAALTGIAGTIVTVFLNYYYRERHEKLLKLRMRHEGVTIDEAELENP